MSCRLQVSSSRRPLLTLRPWILHFAHIVEKFWRTAMYILLWAFLACASSLTKFGFINVLIGIVELLRVGRSAWVHIADWTGPPFASASPHACVHTRDRFANSWLWLMRGTCSLSILILQISWRSFLCSSHCLRGMAQLVWAKKHHQRVHHQMS